MTDADVVLNRIPFDHFMGGRRQLKRKEALTAIKEKIAEPLEWTSTMQLKPSAKLLTGRCRPR